MTPADAPRDRSFTDLIADHADAVRGGSETPRTSSADLPADLRTEAEEARALVERLQAELGAGGLGTDLDSPTVLVGDGVFRPSAAARPGMPPQIGRFQLLHELGRGGFGIVYLALDPILRREVALKVPRPEALLTPELRERFLREARAAGSLNHPNVVPVYEAGESDSVCYIASEYCPGANLAEYLHSQKEPMTPRAAATLIAALADAVQHAHDRGILHRDLKPANVLLSVPSSEFQVPRDEGTAPGSLRTYNLELTTSPKVTDFGLARLAEGSLEETGSSVILGTPLYMAPEQAEGRSAVIGPPTDVYALGAILYECLTGRPPFPGRTLVEVLDRVRSEEPERLSQLRPGLPHDLEAICLKCLAREPSQRYARADELATDLRRFLKGEPVSARLPNWLTKLNAWSLRRERIREAGLLAAVINATVCAYQIFIISCLVLFGIGPTLPNVFVGALEIIIVILLLHLPNVWAGLKTAAGRPWALRVGMGTSLLLWVAVVVTLMIPSEEWGGFHRDFAERWIIQNLLTSIFTAQVLAYVVAVRAYYHLRRTGHFAPG